MGQAGPDGSRDGYVLLQRLTDARRWAAKKRRMQQKAPPAPVAPPSDVASIPQLGAIAGNALKLLGRPPGSTRGGR
jgi:hypothetical protein